MKKSLDKKINMLCLCALFAALCCACTFVCIPLPVGYFNLGDAAALLGACILSPISAAVAAAVGCSLADLLLGYTVYVPATAIIKAALTLVFCLCFKSVTRILRKEQLKFFGTLVCALVAESVMVGGYFLYEYALLGLGTGALVSVPANILQGVACAVIMSALCGIKRYFKQKN